MSNRICGRCKSTKVVEIGSYCGSTYYSCKNCHDWGEKDQFPEQTLFARITATPEVLAQFLVFHNCIYRGRIKHHSAVVGGEFDSREEAIAATVAKLKEVCDE